MRVSGVGNENATLMFVGEGPGKTESETGIPFHPDAPSGMELGRYLNGYTLPTREQVYITNLVKEWEAKAKTKKQDVTPADVARDEWELKIELETIAPRIIGALGRWSTRWFLGPDADMDAVHSLLFRVHYCQICGQRWSKLNDTPCECVVAAMLTFWVVPIYHPAAGLHQPVLAARTAYDMAQLSQYLTLDPGQLLDRAWSRAEPGTYKRYGHITMAGDGVGEIGIDTEYDPVTKVPWGLSISDTPGQGYVIKGGGLHATAQYPRFIFHFFGADAPMLAKLGVPINEDRFDDTGVMAFLLGVEPQALKDLALRHLGRVRKTFLETFGEHQDVIGKSGKVLKKKKLVIKTMDEVPEQVATDYAGADPDDTRSLKPILMQKIRDLGLEQVYEIDRRVLPLYSRMEQVGLPVDPDHFTRLGADLASDLEVRTLILQADYPDFNPASPDQVAHLLFDQLKLPAYKKTPTGKRFTTNDKILESLTAHHPVVQDLIDWREVSKLKSTFVDPILGFCGPAGDGAGLRLYYQLLPTRVVSGRLAAKDPNVLAFPKYTKIGKAIRQGFRARPGRKLGSYDLNQIELRVLALDSGSGTLIDIFNKGLDQHGLTAQRIFGGQVADYKEGAKRVAAKAVNFSIPMGTTRFGLAEQMRKNKYPFPELAGAKFKSHKERRNAEAEVCDAWITEIIKFWDIGPYISNQHAMARSHGYVEDRWGRKRFLPSVLSPNEQVREAAKREAQAFGPQAGARGFMKTIEWRVWREVIQPLQADGYYMEPVLDIHDDLTCEFQEDLTDLWYSVVGSIFNYTFTGLEVPITAKGSVGQSWGDL